MLRRILTPCALVALLVSFPGVVAAQTVVPVADVELIQGDGSPAGEYLVVDSFDPETGPLFSAGLLETVEGHRLLQIDRLDRDEGLRIQRLEDLGSGWWAELEVDLGLRNLGSPLDHGDPMEWSMAVSDRSRKEKPTTTYTIRMSDGRTARWIKPYGQFAEGDQARKGALVELAASWTEAELPASTVTALETLAALRSSDDAPDLIADKLFDSLWLAYSAATQTQEPSGSSEKLSFRKTTSPSERLLKVIQRNTRDLRPSGAEGG